MLRSLTIANVVLIEKLTVTFGRGLNALTGETGAGKSILLDSLSLALGARGEAGLVRTGAEQASITAEFDIPAKHPAHAILSEQGIDLGDTLLLRRVVMPDGRTRAYINDQPVSVGLLKTVGDRLIEIHGQFDTHNLTNAKYHRDLLDEYGVSAEDRAALALLWRDWRAAEDQYVTTRAQAEQARRDEDYLRAMVEQLDELSPKAGEEEKLTTLRQKLMKRDQVIGAFQSARQGIEEAESALHTVWRAVEKTGGGNEVILSALDRAGVELKEAMAGVEDKVAEVEAGPDSLNDIDDRLFALKGQARKLGCGVDDLAAKRDEVAAQLNVIEHQDDILAKLDRARQFARREYESKAKDVSTERKRAAKRLDTFVAKELPPLKLDKARFETMVEPLPESEWGESGFDRVAFLVATNPGAAAGPLNKIASGGEMARFMLALKVVLAETGSAGTLVFDEVDSGIGGATASAVGERLARLSAAHQVLVVTHSPQVAARAQAHFVVSKSGKTSVKTDVIALPDVKRRLEEIARMLAGEKITDEARAAAGKLMEANAA
jgi:DNA repair protein RecN (Recombination protein N)